MNRDAKNILKTHKQILESIRAREAGKKAVQESKKLGANTYPEDSELHWDWLDAWCVERARMHRHNVPDETTPDLATK